MFYPAIGRYGIASRLYIASKLGLDVLSEGGNVFDAAITVSSILSLFIPHTGGLGGDAFILGRLNNGEIIAYNGSGRSPKNFPVDFFLENRPLRGGLTISVPGLVDTWIYINEEYGSMELSRLLKPAITLGENGFYPPIQTLKAISLHWDELSSFKSWKETYGRFSRGELIRLTRFSNILKMIARYGWDGFYTGKVAERIVSGLNREGSPISTEDFESHRGMEFKPIKIEYGDSEIYELPPNTQGITTLEILRLVDKLGLRGVDRSEDWWNKYFNIAAISYMDRDRYIGDPDYMDIDPEYILSRDHLSGYIKILRLGSGDTTFFTLSDKYGNILGFIQSLFHPFGSGIVSEEIPFQNRLIGFSKVKGLPNSPSPGKRPLHTLSILMAERGDRTYIVGCAGGDLRPQIHSQVIINILDYGMDVAEAVMAKRNMIVRWGDGKPIDGVSEDKLKLGYMSNIQYPSRRVGIAYGLMYDMDKRYIELFSDVRGGGSHLSLNH